MSAVYHFLDIAFFSNTRTLLSMFNNILRANFAQHTVYQEKTITRSRAQLHPQPQSMAHSYHCLHPHIFMNLLVQLSNLYSWTLSIRFDWKKEKFPFCETFWSYIWYEQNIERHTRIYKDKESPCELIHSLYL